MDEHTVVGRSRCSRWIAWTTWLGLALLVLSSCMDDGGLAAMQAEIRGGSPPDIELNAAGTVDQRE